jgi:hypothetical protein
LRLTDPRFPALPDSAWRLALDRAEALCGDLIGLPVRFSDAGQASPELYLGGALGIPLAEPAGGLAGHLLPRAGERDALVRTVADGVRASAPEQVRTYLPADRAGAGAGARVLAHEIVRTFQDRAAALLVPGGVVDVLPSRVRGLVTMTPWAAALKRAGAAPGARGGASGAVPDVLVTNVPLLYGRKDGSAVHALVRGGLIGGFAAFAKGAGRFGGGAVVTTFPLASAHRVVRGLGGEELGGTSLATALAGLIAHELFHLALRLPDNYDHDRCLMRPPAGLDYHRFWFGGRPVAACPTCRKQARAGIPGGDAGLIDMPAAAVGRIF